MKKAVLIVVVLVVLLGGGIAGLVVLKVGPFATLLGGPAEDAPAADPATAATSLIEMETMGIPVFEDGKVAQRVFFNFRLEVIDAERKKVLALMPRISDSFLRDLMVYLPRHLRSYGDIEEVILERRLRRLAAKVAGGQAIRQVRVAARFTQ